MAAEPAVNRVRHNVLVNDDHLVIMCKVPCVWGRLETMERLALHRVVEEKVKEIGDAVPSEARPRA